MTVIKLGGSLVRSDVLPSCLQAIQSRCREHGAVIVPGGGTFADQIRLAQSEWLFDDLAAHRMALLAMQQMAHLFAALRPEWDIAHSVSTCRESLQHGRIAIWSPDVKELEAGAVEPCWDVTSDSLSAWLANRLPVRQLILVKSALITQNSILALQRQGIIDPAFDRYADGCRYQIDIIHYHQL